MPGVGKIIDSDTLPERLSSAEIVIVGKPVSIDERAIIDRASMLNEYGQSFNGYIYYDLGEIEVKEILKGSYAEDFIHIKFLSFDQTQHPPNNKADCQQFSYFDIWETGIWLIGIDQNREPRFRVNRGDYAPLDRLEDVRKYLEDD